VEKKLSSFLKKEREAEEDFDSDVVKAYLRKSPFKLVETPDSMEIALKRTLGNEEYVRPPARPTPPNIPVHSCTNRPLSWCVCQ
jgi:hypothetical protein